MFFHSVGVRQIGHVMPEVYHSPCSVRQEGRAFR
ncbi:hypothetical protein NITLEN_20609 [Nitrospira lenta]|uniref:Uncharacterized protein n=1 Tax=Nitrospira lenta TaxID=1436998 RepID=A0A330LDG6_9BACT|nr:hypothetical protein NITLEN_20609 [Nitrospira lenta]